MEFHRRAPATTGAELRDGYPVRRVGLLPGSFHPVTRAHIALARAALAVVDEVILTMPREFPHKTYDPPGLDVRLDLLSTAVAPYDRLSTAVTEGGLFIDMARECRAAIDPENVFLICGRDAAERIAGWDYADGPSFEQQLMEYQLLVAARRGEYRAPAEHAHRIMALPLEEEFDWHSATEVRERIRRGGDWRALVPPEVWDRVAKAYR